MSNTFLRQICVKLFRQKFTHLGGKQLAIEEMLTESDMIALHGTPGRV